MTWKRDLVRTGIVVGTLAALILAVTWWPPRGSRTSSTSDVWTCSMHPQIRLPSPGNCPLCGMKLIPISQLSGEREQLELRAGLESAGLKQERRALRVKVAALDWTWLANDALQLAFSLPPGAYATEVLAELGKVRSQARAEDARE